jgi:hypothetical protein
MRLEQCPVPGMTPFFDASRQTLTDDRLWPVSAPHGGPLWVG